MARGGTEGDAEGLRKAGARCRGPEGLGNEKEGGAEGKEGLGKAGGEVLGEQGARGVRK